MDGSVRRAHGNCAVTCQPSGVALLDDEKLEASSVVAHRFMNRQRELRGGNGYAREVGFDVLDELLERLERRAEVAWLDLCCGEGRALGQAAAELEARGLPSRVCLHGVDLVDHFGRPPPTGVTLEVASLHRWVAPRSYDVITCVHGLHYVGDKLGLIARAAGWLAPDGRLAMSLDLDDLRLERGSASRRVPRWLRSEGLRWDSRRRLVRAEGRARPRVPFAYRGAEEQARPNYTGEPAVTSVYAIA